MNVTLINKDGTVIEVSKHRAEELQRIGWTLKEPPKPIQPSLKREKADG